MGGQTSKEMNNHSTIERSSGIHFFEFHSHAIGIGLIIGALTTIAIFFCYKRHQSRQRCRCHLQNKTIEKQPSIPHSDPNVTSSLQNASDRLQQVELQLLNLSQICSTILYNDNERLPSRTTRGLPQPRGNATNTTDP